VTNTRRYAVSLVGVFVVTAVALAGLLFFNARPKLGLDLQGGISVVLTAKGRTVNQEVLDETVSIIRERIDALGAQEPDVSRSGSNNIIVQLPGIKDRKRALEVIGRTAQLRFRQVKDATSVSAAQSAAEQKNLKPRTARYDRAVAAEMAKKGWKLSTGDPVKSDVTYPSKDGKTWYKLGPAEVLGSDIKANGTVAQFDQSTGGWEVELQFNGRGAKAFADITTALAPAKGQLGIVLDKMVESAPAVQQAITDGKARITGNFKEQEAKDLALVLKTGALPLTLERSQVEEVSATLGTAALKSGLIAGAIGIALVAIYMFAFYRLLGLITLLGLGVFSALILGIIGLIGVTRGFSLTLAGVAGLIVSVGIAADSYIIYFERVKDELKEGKTLRSAAERAFRSAFRTNLAADGVTFLAAIILWAIAVGPVKGFALTLGISGLLDIALLYFYAHPFVALISRNRTKAKDMKSVGMAEVATA
jgi:preprotein translocase subunit SecD